MNDLCQNIVSAKRAHKASLYGVWLMLLTSLTPGFLLADTMIQAPGTLREVARQFLKTQFSHDKSIRYSIGKLDPRLRLAACKNAIEAFLPENQRLLGYTIVGVRCTDNKGWKIHVPVHIRQFKNILVSNRNLPRGHSLAAADVISKNIDVSLLNQGFYEKVTQLQGLVLTRSILRDQYLVPGMLSKPRWVQRGQTITILAKTGQLAIHVRGKALMDGRQGDLVRIKNTSTNKELRGIVVAEGVVKVTL